MPDGAGITQRQGGVVARGRDPLYGAQVQLLYEGLPPGLVVTAVNVLILAVVEWQAVPSARLAIWVLAAFLVTAGRYLLTRHYRQQQTSDNRLWGRRYALATAVAGLVWGSVAVWLFPQALFPQIFVFLMLTGMTTAAVVSFAAVFPVALLFVVPTLLPLVLRLFFLHSRLHHAMAVLALLFLGVMLLTAHRMGRTIRMSLRLRFENHDLIARLEGEKAAIERLNADLNREISERARMTQEVLDREADLRAVVDNVEEGIITVDKSGALRSLNREATRIFGYSEGDLIGHHFSVLVPPAERAEYSHYMDSRIERAGGRMSGLGLEVNGLRRDGTVFPMELGLSAMQVGHERRFIGIARDITARKRAERLKSDLVSSLSHELKTPLTAAIGSLGLVTEALAPTSGLEVGALLRMARNNLERLSRVIHDILDVDHLQLTHLKLTLAPIVLRDLAEGAVRADSEYAQSHGVRLALDPCMATAVTHGDRTLLLQALSNLITNAIHLSPPDSTVELAVSHDANDGVISVRDCGTAIPVSIRPHLFEAFGCSCPVTAPVAPLGLSIARAIVEKHGGTIGYEPRKAGGSHFFLRLPLRL
ncbi:MAG: sensor histidine kinase [Acidiferrobacter sp.]